jgi:hypothetical protein
MIMYEQSEKRDKGDMVVEAYIKIDKLQKKLDIATEALEKINKGTFMRSGAVGISMTFIDCAGIRNIVEQALSAIKGDE